MLNGNKYFIVILYKKIINKFNMYGMVNEKYVLISPGYGYTFTLNWERSNTLC